MQNSSPPSGGLIAVIILAGLLLTGCSGIPVIPQQYPGSLRQAHLDVVHIARELIGIPYHYGGDTPRQGFDCSGLVYFANARAGIHLPRTSYAQYRATRPVSYRHLLPGDLVFFWIRRHRVSHVGIYIGHGRFIHAPARGQDVTIDSLRDPYWSRRFVRGGRTL